MERRTGTRPLNILIVDDEPGILEVSKEYLESQYGMRVIALQKSIDVMQVLSEESFDAIVSDYQMPIMDGLSLLKQVRSKNIDIAFILFTGKGREEVAMEALNNGADFYVQKGGDTKAQYSDLAHKISVAVERYVTRKEMTRTNSLLHCTLESIPDGVIVIDRNGKKVIVANRAEHEILAAPDGSLIGTDADRLIKLISRDGTDREIATMLRENIIPTDVEMHNFTITTKNRSFEVSTSPYMVDNVIQGGIWTTTDVTGRMEADRYLKESEQKLRRIVSAAPVCLAVVKDRRYVEINERLENLLGYNKGELIGNHVRVYYETQDEYERAGRELYSPGSMKDSMASTKTRWIKKDGTLIDLLLSVSYLDANDKDAGYIAVATDLTELMRAEGQLQDRLEFESLLAKVSRLFTQIDVVDLNDGIYKALAMMGEQRGADRAYLFEENSETRTMSNTVEWTADGIASTKAGLQNVPVDKFPWWREELLKHGLIFLPDVDELPAEVERNDLRSQNIQSLVVSAMFNGNVLKGYVGFDYVRRKRPHTKEDLELLRFIGEIFSYAMVRREKEVSIQKERERLRNLLNSSPIAVIVYDLVGDDLVMSFSNEVSKQLLSKDMDALVGKPVKEVLPNISDDTIDSYMKCLRDGLRRYDERDYHDKDVHARFQIWTVRLSSERLAVFFQNITDVALLNERLTLANKKLTLFGKLTRHDVANKILAVRANLDLLKLRLDSPTLIKYVNGAEKGASDIAEIMDTLRYYLDIGVDKVCWVDLGDAMDDAIRLLGHDRSASPRIMVSEELMKYEVRSDKLLPIVLFNLLSNSIRHGGKVSRIDLTVERHGDEIRLVIEDDGQGVPEEMRFTLFDFELDGRQGHGLNFIKEALNTSGMNIEYVGDPGHGARFIIKVPNGQYREKKGTTLAS
ncbi:MAG: PAS domain S-box protein [Methanomassiliicoccales archaeon]|nr:PAS domain S-box protein [Methanomassiliicoccales archaeon]